MLKTMVVILSVLASIGLAAFAPGQPPPDDAQPKAKGKAEHKKKGDPKKREEAKKKEEPGPKGDLRRAYDLLRRLRTDDGPASRPEERVREWTERARKYYRDGLKALDDGDDFLAHEYGAIAHDLARAADHARNAALLDRRDADLPPPPEGRGPEDTAERVRRDLNHAYERITEPGGSKPAPGAEFAVKASRELYTAARHDIEAGREERGGELARAAEAMTHVTEHLGHVADGPPDGRDRAGARREPPPPDRPEPKAKQAERRDSDLPPPLPRE